MKIIVSGGRGFIGAHLVPALLAAGHEVTVWTRKPQEENRAGVGAFYWDPMGGPPQMESLEGIDVVVHLAGEPVAQRWSDEVKRKIRDSRVLGTRNLVEGIAKMRIKPKALICSSATGFYGDRGDETLTEKSAAGEGFLVNVCREWEHEADAATQLGLRVAKIRTGVVIGAGGGALAKMLPAFRAGAGGKLGSGKQWMSWIHIADIVGLYRLAIEQNVQGVVNGVGPEPVRNEVFTEALAKAVHRPALLPVPKFVLKLVFGEMADVLLSSQRILPKAAGEHGFVFKFPEVFAAMLDVVKEPT